MHRIRLIGGLHTFFRDSQVALTVNRAASSLVRRWQVVACLAALFAGAVHAAGLAGVAPHCKEWVARLPNLKRELCEAARLAPASAHSVRGRPLLVSDMPAAGARLRVLVIGAIHGDELSSASLALHWIRLAQQSQNRPQEEDLPVHWRFVPVLNPDGLLARPPTRTNAHGVDLNRNFPTPEWALEAPAYWARRTGRDPRRWPGPRPLSEPETRFLDQQMQRFDPQLIVSIHAPYGVLDFDGPTVAPARLGRLYLDQVGVFPGSLGNYGGVHKGVPVVTVELPHAHRTPPEAEIRQMWTDLLRWAGERLPR